MGYRIQYEPSLNAIYPIKTKAQIQKKILMYVCLFSGILFILTIPAFRNWIWEFLIPGNTNITTTAFSKMLSGIKEGKNISEVIAAFCREIMIYA